MVSMTDCHLILCFSEQHGMNSIDEQVVPVQYRSSVTADQGSVSRQTHRSLATNYGLVAALMACHVLDQCMVQ